MAAVDVNAIPDTDPAPTGQSATWFILNGQTGTFEYRKGENKATTDAVKGILVDKGILLEWDPEGNPAHNVPPRWELSVFLLTREHGLVQLLVGAPVGVSTLLDALALVPVNGVVHVSTRRAGKSCYINVQLFDPNKREWHEVRPPKTGEPPEVLYRNSLAAARNHPAFDKENSHPPRPGEAGNAATGGGSANGGANPASQAAGNAGTQPSITGEGKTAFGFKPPRWPLRGHWDQPATDKQRNVFEERIAERGIEAWRAAIYPVILKGYEISDELAGKPTLGGYALVNDFLAGASPEQLSAATAKATEYDPFADE